MNSLQIPPEIVIDFFSRLRVKSLLIPNSLTTMSDVPPDVLSEILSRLPVKSVLRFRSVSKPCCALIDSPYFVNLHLNQSMKTYKLLTFIRDSISSNSFYSMYLGPGATAVKLDTPFYSMGFFQQVLGSCNGLICLSMGRTNREILLWNPSTNKYKVIQAMPMHHPPGSKQTFAIDRVGYDHVNDDYKVVRLSQSTGSDSNLVDSKVTVYSLKLNMWQSVEQDFPYHVCHERGHGVSCSGPMTHGVSVCGAIHWVVTQNPPPDMNFLIAAFDLHRQSFQLVSQPEYSDKYVTIDLGTLGGCLCVVGNHERGVDVWVMANYGVKESWSKLIMMPFSDPKMNAFSYVRPLVYLKNGKQVLLELDYQWFVRYDLKKKTWKLTKIRDGSYIPTLVYHESLF